VFLYGISLQLFLRRKDPDAGSESGMTGRDCHPVVLTLMSSRNGSIRDLVLALSKDVDAGSESGMTGRE
jgi:hypothetical protein